MSPGSTHRWLVAASTLSCAALLVVLAARVEFLVNDDTYVYFNYARNWLAGRPFAYDPRDIPSEGFTSLLYLMLLLPGEALGVDPMLSAVGWNLLAVIGCVGLAVALVRRAGWLTPASLPIFAVLFAALLALDAHVVLSIGRGLETLLSPASVLAALLPLTSAMRLDRADPVRARSVTAFLAMAGLAAAIRPENALVLGVAGGVLLLPGGPGTRRVLLRVAVLLALIAAGAAAKLSLLGDVFPTGYYRKAGAWGGGSYALSALGSYAWAIVALAGLAGADHWLRRGAPRPRPAGRAPALAFGLAAIASWLFVVSTEPLIGYAFRYVVNAYVLLLMAVAIAAVRVLEDRVPTPWRVAATAGAMAAVTLLAGAAGLAAVPRSEPFRSRLALAARAGRATEQHHYLALGRELRERLPAHEEITVVFGDAGALPYAFRSRFVDPNGLTEPAIARLFRQPDGPEKTRRFLEAVLGAEPDLVVVGFGPLDSAGAWPSPVNPHSPFRGPTPLAVFEEYHRAGVRYVCSLRAYYDLHVGVRRDSPHAAAIVAALGDRCASAGYRIPGGLTVIEGAGAVRFPPWRPASAAPR